jgi:hypothetical protein
MNGPFHYAEAERLLALAAQGPGQIVSTEHPVTAEMAERVKEIFGEAAKVRPAVLGPGVTYHSDLIPTAQVHATLALAAATAENESEVLSTAWAGALR